MDALCTDGKCDTRVSRAQSLGATANMTVYTGAKHSFDMAKETTSGFTLNDVDANNAADPVAMKIFDARLK